MKKSVLYIFVLLLAFCSSCKKVESDAAGMVHNMNISVNPFQLISEDLGKYVYVTRLDLAVYDENDAIVYIAHHADTSDVNFLNFSDINLQNGTYTVVAVGHRGNDTAVMDTPSLVYFADSLYRDLFCATQSFVVSSASIDNFSLTLTRVVARFELISNNLPPASVERVEIVFGGGGSSFNPSTKLCPSHNGRVVSIVRNAGWDAMQVPVSFVGYIMPHLVNETMNVTVNAKNSSGTVLYTNTFSNLALGNNRQVRATGNFFSNAVDGGITINNSWLGTTDITF